MHVSPRGLGPVLPKHCGRVVGKDDVILRVPLPELLGDLPFQIIVLVIGLPIAERHAQAMKQRTVDINSRSLLGQDAVLGYEL